MSGGRRTAGWHCVMKVGGALSSAVSKIWRGDGRWKPVGSATEEEQVVTGDDEEEPGGVEGNHGGEAADEDDVVHDAGEGGVMGRCCLPSTEGRLRDLRMPCKVRYRLKHVARLRCGSWREIWPQVRPLATPSQMMASSMSEKRLRGLPCTCKRRGS